MAEYIKHDEFISIALGNQCDPHRIIAYIKQNIDENYSVNITHMTNRVNNYKRKGLLPLDSGNSVEPATVLRGVSTLYNDAGQIVQQWVKSDVSKTTQLEAIQQAISEMANNIEALPEIEPPVVSNDELATLYISNDIHFGLLTWDEETGVSWDTNKAVATMTSAYDYLFECSPTSKIGIVVDLGDMTEADDFTNLTPTGKNPLDTDSRYPKVLRAAWRSLEYAIIKALRKHELVYFYNIAGNHDISSGHAVREAIIAKFENNPRVIVCTESNPIKYHQHGKTLLGFAHGDGLKFNRAGETMAVDNQDIFSSTEHRFFHFG